ncbi:MAG: hypothetical protein WBW85_19130 [Terriglobales bacterium]|jgi:cyclopropane-fatty-acyl-phospholipid synthase
MAALANSPFEEKASLTSAEFLEALLADCPKRDFQVRFWDNTSWGVGGQPRFTLVLKHPGALRAMFSRPSELTLGEAYIYFSRNAASERVLILLNDGRSCR